ncbi:MAG: MFS transporter [Phenylobacterium sp.]|nr:MAG: MFS transporter [Phenylobacterium sp.]
MSAVSSAFLADVPPRPQAASGAFLAALAIAQVGAFLSFMPLLTILAPLKAAAIDPDNKAWILAQVGFWGALVAGGANILAGALSDSTRSRFGRRRPWLIIGATGTAASCFVIMRADATPELVGGVLLFQLCLNLLFGPLVALLADQVPPAQRGRAAAFIGLAPPAGAMTGALLVGVALPQDSVRYAVIAGLLVAATIPVLLLARETPTGPGVFRLARPRQAAKLRPFRLTRDFAVAWLSRLLVQAAITIVSLFTLFNIQDRGAPPGGLAPEALLGLLVIGSSLVQVAASLAGGFLSDHLRRRKAFVLAAGLLVAAAAILLAFSADWRLMAGAFAVFGAGYGLFTAVDAALITEVLPSAHDAGRDLGLSNLANTLPQMFAPLLGAVLLQTYSGYAWLYLAAGVAAAAGGLLILAIRRAR